jgi:hypothetical protein
VKRAAFLQAYQHVRQLTGVFSKVENGKESLFVMSAAGWADKLLPFRLGEIFEILPELFKSCRRERNLMIDQS